MKAASLVHLELRYVHPNKRGRARGERRAAIADRSPTSRTYIAHRRTNPTSACANVPYITNTTGTNTRRSRRRIDVSRRLRGVDKRRSEQATKPGWWNP